MSAEQNKEIIRRAAVAISGGDMAGFLADAADDFSLTVMGTPPGPTTLQGKQRVVEILSKVFDKRIVGSAVAMTIENLIAEGEYVVEQATGKARTVDGKDYNNTYCRVWRIVDGKIKSLNECMDTELARECLWK